MNKTLAVVVTYNRKDMLVQCLQHLNDQTYQSFDVLVVDNNSTDGTDEAVKPFLSTSIKYHKLPDNIGGAGGFNYGMRFAVEQGYDYCWIMDDDCLPKAEAVSQLLLADKTLNGEYGWLSSKSVWIDGSLCTMNVQRKTPYKEITFDGNNPKLIASDMASFVSLFIPTVTIKKYGLPIKEFFIWTDDWEFTRRISREVNCYTVPDSVVVHAMKNKTPVNIATDSSDRMNRYKYFYRNDVYLYRREGFVGWCWIVSKDLWHSIQVVFKSKESKKVKLHTIWGGFNSGKRFMPNIEYVRGKE